MKITKNYLRKVIFEEISKFQNDSLEEGFVKNALTGLGLATALSVPNIAQADNSRQVSSVGQMTSNSDMGYIESLRGSLSEEDFVNADYMYKQILRKAKGNDSVIGTARALLSNFKKENNSESLLRGLSTILQRLNQK